MTSVAKHEWVESDEMGPVEVPRRENELLDRLNLLSIQTVAKLFGVSVRTVRNVYCGGEGFFGYYLPSVRLGKKRFIRVEDFSNFVDLVRERQAKQKSRKEKGR